jgi:nucleoside-diphosphate-sugar epimerase
MDGSTDGGELMSGLVCLGFGYCAQHYVGEFGWRFDRIIGTTRSADRAAALDRRSFSGRRAGVAVFDGVSVSRDLVDAIAEADALLVSAAPDGGRDPVLAALGREIEQAPRLRTVIYLSSLGVYGDSGGRWIDETAATVPELARRGSARVDAERAWSALGRQRSLPVAILRLGGIYGPGQNAMVRLLRGTVHRVAKPGHVSNRIHVLDIAQAIDAALGRRADGVFNVVDDEPAPPSEQIAFAAALIGISPPPEIPYARAHEQISPFVLSFYEGCIRARNDRLKSVLGVALRYPNYRDGLRALHAAGDHLAITKPGATDMSVADRTSPPPAVREKGAP